MFQVREVGIEVEELEALKITEEEQHQEPTPLDLSIDIPELASPDNTIIRGEGNVIVEEAQTETINIEAREAEKTICDNGAHCGVVLSDERLVEVAAGKEGLVCPIVQSQEHAGLGEEQYALVEDQSVPKEEQSEPLEDQSVPVDEQSVLVEEQSFEVDDQDLEEFAEKAAEEVVEQAVVQSLETGVQSEENCFVFQVDHHVDESSETQIEHIGKEHQIIEYQEPAEHVVCTPKVDLGASTECSAVVDILKSAPQPEVDFSVYDSLLKQQLEPPLDDLIDDFLGQTTDECIVSEQQNEPISVSDQVALTPGEQSEELCQERSTEQPAEISEFGIVVRSLCENELLPSTEQEIALRSEQELSPIPNVEPVSHNDESALPAVTQECSLQPTEPQTPVSDQQDSSSLPDVSSTNYSYVPPENHINEDHVAVPSPESDSKKSAANEQDDSLVNSDPQDNNIDHSLVTSTMNE